MHIVIARDARDLGVQAAAAAVRRLREAIERQGSAVVVWATGISQFETLSAVTAERSVDWSRVTAFHLDEYLGLNADHPASFGRYLRERVASKIALAAFHFIDGQAPDPQAECRRLGGLIAARPIDVALIGIGENGHLAFNDPPADFESDESFRIVFLDEACRRQQCGEGWFPTLDDVPLRAITLSIRQLLRSRSIVASVPESRKAAAVAAALQGEVTPRVPASVLRQHPDAAIYLDPDSASRLSEATRRQYSGARKA